MSKGNEYTLYGLTGYPLGHSLSPILHNWGFAQLGLKAVYLKWAQAPENLSAFITALRLLPISGLSVTIPHKETIIPLLDQLTPLAKSIGAVNTLFWRDGQLCGDNTDIKGFCAPLQGLNCDTALVLGAGGSARAVIAGLERLQVKEILVCARNTEKASALQQSFNCKVISWAEKSAVLRQAGQGRSGKYKTLILVNTTPLGMYGSAQYESPVSQEEFALLPKPENVIAYDLIFNPLETVFLGNARKAGCTCIDGLNMLVAQGLEQFFIWTGQSLPFADTKRELLAYL